MTPRLLVYRRVGEDGVRARSSKEEFTQTPTASATDRRGEKSGAVGFSEMLLQ